MGPSPSPILGSLSVQENTALPTPTPISHRPRGPKFLVNLGSRNQKVSASLTGALKGERSQESPWMYKKPSLSLCKVCPAW